MNTAEIIMEALGGADAPLRLALAGVDCARRIAEEKGWTIEPEDRARIAETAKELRMTAELLIKHAERLEKMVVRDFPQFEEGKTYLAQMERWGGMMGHRTMLGYTELPAKCTRRTPCYVTFEIEVSGRIISAKARLLPNAEGEYAVIKKDSLNTILIFANHLMEVSA